MLPGGRIRLGRMRSIRLPVLLAKLVVRLLLLLLLAWLLLLLLLRSMEESAMSFMVVALADRQPLDDEDDDEKDVDRRLQPSRDWPSSRSEVEEEDANRGILENVVSILSLREEEEEEEGGEEGEATAAAAAVVVSAAMRSVGSLFLPDETDDADFVVSPTSRSVSTPCR